MCPPAQAPLGAPHPPTPDRGRYRVPRRQSPLRRWCALGLVLCSWLFGLTPSADAAAHSPARLSKSSAVWVTRPSAVTSAARYVQLRGSARGALPRTLVVQRRVQGTWRKVRTFPNAHRWQVTVRLAQVPATFRVVARTGRGTVASNRVRVTLTRPPATLPLSLPLDAHDDKRAVMLRDTNAYRARYGLPPLRPLAAVDKIATRWSRHQAATRRMSHNPSYWTSYPAGYRAAAENVAYGFAPDQVVSQWFYSPPHRANLLGDYTHVGFGYAIDGHGVAYYTQNFARY